MTRSCARSFRRSPTKSEAFNGFTKWLSFGSSGILPENDRQEQRKLIKYNHLVANCLIFYNVFMLSRVLQDLIQEGYAIAPELLEALSPYMTHHINRFGRYDLELTKQPPQLDYSFSLIQATHEIYVSAISE